MLVKMPLLSYSHVFAFILTSVFSFPSILYAHNLLCDRPFFYFLKSYSLHCEPWLCTQCHTSIVVAVLEMMWLIIVDTPSFVEHINPEEVARRHRHSPWPLKTVEEALSIILTQTNVCSKETVSYKHCRGRYLAQPVYAPEPLPPFPASIKDGYAVIGMYYRLTLSNR